MTRLPRRIAGGIRLALACLVIVSAYAQSPQGTVTNVVNRTSDCVVQIVISDSTGKEIALGSGFIVSADGQLVTNYHVVRQASSAIIRLANGAFFPVEGVLALNPDKDLAVLKVQGKNLPFVTFAEPESVRVGDHVVAIGSPLGLEGTVSDGIVSAIRDVDGKTWIQTTAPVSRGNSGGPLLDMQGNVVGVVTWGYLQLGQNLNFAAPAIEAKALLSGKNELKPLGAAVESASSSRVGDPVALSKLWTSVTSGRDYKVRQEGEYLYSEWVNLPSQLQGTSAFTRSELKRDSDGRWRGKAHSFLPCDYTDGWTGQTRVNWCRIDTDIQVDRLSETRIEGVTETFEKFDCRKCKTRDSRPTPFTLIPKD